MMRKYMRIQKSVRAAVVASAAVVGLVVGSGSASAAVDDSNSVVDGGGNTITVSQSDTFINSVFPLDGSPLTREWFHNGRAIVDVTGPDAEDFSGTVTIGYQVGYPASLGGELTFDYTTPGLSISSDDFTLSDVLPQAGVGVTLEPGPGIETVEVASGAASGAHTEIQIANLHGTATNIAGNVSVRPYVQVVSDNGDVATTFGQPWRFN
ncbi:MspA family porin [Rhodococcus kroppenstedtii]|uniref:MspA family porin n=2 Tax=Mycobacteriales TaxID=85007 RepID=A0ABS7NWU4_9NOCA|nr:MspA family porin [Rhodococcus kroppenstedtii]MBY6322509.1 MspA family porin [Rhodococcus kroppenstedtii]MBY6401313.1 MspA family porin [Rhodococcus kroppenstedtii]